MNLHRFNSIHIDLDKGIYELNGEKMERVTALELTLDATKWSLDINKSETYVQGSRNTKE